MERIQHRLLWLLLTVCTGVFAVGAGVHLFGNAACQRLIQVLLYGAALLATIAMLARTIAARNDSVLSMILSPLLVAAFTLGSTLVVGPFLAQLPQAKAMFCPDCDEVLANAEELRLAGKLDGAEYLARQGLQQTADSRWRAGSACELAYILYDRAEIEMGARRCPEALGTLKEAHDLAAQYGCDRNSVLMIEERSRRCQDMCATPTPTVPPTKAPPTKVPLDIQVAIQREQSSGAGVAIDVAVLDKGKFRSGVPPEALTVRIDGKPVPVLFVEERHSDDPVCIVVVVDNSSSIAAGVGKIQNAIIALNERRKLGDELGLVLFAKSDEVEVKQQPSTEELNPTVVNGKGDGTALWDGILRGIELLRACGSQQRYLIVLTDGDDNESVWERGRENTFRAREVHALAEEAGISICTVGIQSQWLKEEPLKLAACNCRYRLSEDFDALVSHFQEIFGFVRDFYRIQIPSDAVPQGRHSVTVRALDAAEVTVEFEP